MAYEWQLNGCCGTEERIFLCVYAGYVVVFAMISKTALMKPLRLLAVFLHEFSHAALAWMTGGQVTGIEVNENEGNTNLWHSPEELLTAILIMMLDISPPYKRLTDSIFVVHKLGGVTKYRGGCRICIIPAGYTGCAFWAGLFVALSGSRIGATIVTGGMSLALLVSLL